MDANPRTKLDEKRKPFDSNPAHEGGLKTLGFLNEARPYDKISSLFDFINKRGNSLNIVLAIAIELNIHIIAMLERIAMACLNSAANT